MRRHSRRSCSVDSSVRSSAAHGLLDLGLREVGTALPPVVAFWRDLGARYVTTPCTSAEDSATDLALRTIAVPSRADLDRLVAAAPPMSGGEYLTSDVLAALWERVDDACRAERIESKQSLQGHLRARNPARHLVGRVHFNLAENRGDEDAPYAFIATYTTQLPAQGRAMRLAAPDGRGGGDLPPVALEAGRAVAVPDGCPGAGGCRIVFACGKRSSARPAGGFSVR